MAYDPRQWYSYSKSYTEPVSIPLLGDVNEEKNEGVTDSVTHQLKRIQEEQPSVCRPEVTSTSQANKFVLATFTIKEEAEGYDPCTPALDASKMSDTSIHLPESKDDEVRMDPVKLDRFISSLQKMIHYLPIHYKKWLPYDTICQLAHALIDGTVFEIAKGLQDIQLLTEKNLTAKRRNHIAEQKAKKAEILKRQQLEIAKCQAKPHQILMLAKQHEKEMRSFQHRCDKETNRLDQNLVLELDQLVSDQQATLQRAGLPLFFITNKAEEVKLQMYLLDFMTKLAAG